MKQHTILLLRSRAALYRLVALGALLVPPVIAACGGDNSGGGGGGGAGY